MLTLALACVACGGTDDSEHSVTEDPLAVHDPRGEDIIEPSGDQCFHTSSGTTYTGVACNPNQVDKCAAGPGDARLSSAQTATNEPIG